MANEFNPSVNYSLHSSSPDTTSNIVSDVAGGVVATVVDAGASIWNSMPFTPEVETADLLRNVSNNALRVYEENPDTIHTASFIGGMFIPMGLAVKGLGAMRAGVKGVNWFTKAGREADLASVNKLFSTAQGGTPAYRAATRAMYAKSAVNQGIDALAAESALVLMMNKHPFMEDYFDEPVANFAKGLVLGGALGIGIGHVADRFAVRAIGSKLNVDALDSIHENMKNVYTGMTGAVALQSNRLNINSLTNMIETGAKVGKDSTNDLTISMAEKMRTQATLLETKMFDEVVSSDMAKLGVKDKNVFMEYIATKPEMFGVDEVSFAASRHFFTDQLVTKTGSVLSRTPILQNFAKNKKTGKQTARSTEAMFFPNVGKDGGYGSILAGKHYAGAAAIFDTVDDAGKSIAKNAHYTPTTDSSLELLATSSAEAQAKYFGWQAKAAGMKTADFAKTLVGDTDNPALTAMLTQLRTNAELKGKTIKMKDRSAVYADKLDQQMIDTGVTSESYAAAAQKIINETRLAKMDDINILTDTKISADAREFMSDWIGGPGAWDMHIGATSKFARGFSKIGKTRRETSSLGLPPQISGAEKMVDEIYESASSARGRAEFAKLADDEGYVYLYRGVKAQEVRGSAPVESMTTNYQKASDFAKRENGRVDLYRVHPDDIVAILKDIGPQATDNTEILVRASARASEVTFKTVKDAAGNNTIQKIMPKRFTPSVGGKPVNDIHEMGEKEIAKKIRENKAFEMDALLANGIPAASIAIKTNTPKEVVEAYIYGGSKGPGALEDVLSQLKDKVPMDATTGNAVSSVEEASALMGAANKPLLLKGNMRKNPYVEGHAALSNKQLANINDLFVDQIMLSSKSTAVKQFGMYMNENADMFSLLNQMLSNANQQSAGVRFLNSFDFYSRAMKDLGPAISAIAKQREHISNQMIDKIAKPIQTAMQGVIKDQVAVVEFNTFKSLNDSLQGWRGINKEGYLVQKVMRDGPNGKQVEVMEPVPYQGNPYRVTDQKVLDLLSEVQAQSQELREMHNAVRKIKGVKPVNDIGLWMPSFNPTNKFIAYVHNLGTDAVQLIHAGSLPKLTEMVMDYRKHLSVNGVKDTNIITNPAHGIKVINKGIEQEMWSRMNGRMDALTMERADVSMLKSGSASLAFVPNSLDVFGEVLEGYKHYITAQMRNLVDVTMSDSMHMLDRMSAVNKFGEANQPLSTVKKWVSKESDPADVVKRTLLGDSMLGEYGGWQAGNATFETGLMWGQKVFSGAWETAIAPLGRGLFHKGPISPEAMRRLDYEKLTKELADRGVPNPWQGFDDAVAAKYGARSLEESTDTSKRIVYAGNALAATVALRFGELAQPLVNIMSLPILTYLAKAQQTPDVFLGIQKAGGEIPNAAKIMFEGARASNSPMWQSLNDRWEALGYFTAMVSEANATLKMSRSMDKGLIAKTERALDSKMVEWMSKPADVSESFVRRQTMFTGAVLAKRLYPGLDDAGVTVFARDFMDKAVGNFHASQRPVLFQGTLGVALGLFQTYSLTLAQSVYRHLELGNYKTLGKAALVQSGIFGTQSLPGFSAVSNQIGENFSDDHVDLTTGTYRALADPLAETVLYGLPSQLGIGTHTRGDISPRFPGITDDSLVAVNFAQQSMEMIGNVAKAMGQADASIPRAVGEALALQSLSRPIARGAELLTGYSKTGQGNTVQTPDEVWTFAGVGARILGTRPLAELKLREAMHLNSYYNSADSENRDAVIDAIQTKIRGGNLTDENISAAAEKYFSNGGTPTGWRSAINNALARTETSGKEILMDKLKPNSPLQLMIEQLD